MTGAVTNTLSHLQSRADPMDDRSTLSIALSDRYDIDREIGRGGMATVYLARDLKHERLVAIKVLDPELGAVLGAERFLSEIRVTANLQHPNLLPLFDSGAANGLLYYVMPFVEGESLRHRLDREKQLPVDEGVSIAVAIANALDYAHRHGVIHRDLKPENVLLHDGQPLVADFGIALALSKAGGARVTQTGLSLGTPQYMSPEQATGDRVIDARSDIYSLGALTYEMLAGEPPHAGSSAQAIIARLMTEDPRPLTTVRRSVPEQVEAAVHRAMEKLPADRFSTAKEFADAIHGKAVMQRSEARSLYRASSSRVALGMTAACIALAAVATATTVAWYRASHRPQPVPARFAISAPNDERLAFGVGVSVALSHDGSMIAFLAGSPSRIYVRHLDRLDATPLPQTESGAFPQFSPDATSIAFVGLSATSLLQVPVDAGQASTPYSFAKFPLPPSGIAWGHSDDIVFIWGNHLRRATKDGKAHEIATADTLRDASWSLPWVFPDGKTVAFRIVPKGAREGGTGDRLGIVSMDGGPVTRVDLELANVVGYVDGILLFTRGNGNLLAVPFDLSSRRVRGEPILVADGVSAGTANGVGVSAVSAAASDDGTIAYLSGSALSQAEVDDERGNTILTLPGARAYGHPALSPDAARFAIEVADQAQSDIWVFNMASHVLTRLTQSGDAHTPAWTPDGKRVAFIDNHYQAWWMAADGSSAPQRLPIAGIGARDVYQVAFTPDGKSVVARVVVNIGRPGTELLLASLIDKRPPRVIVPVEGAGAGQPVVSPDGRWLAYYSAATGANEVYVRPLSGDGRVQISSSGNTGPNYGATSPMWTGDGRLMFRTGAVIRSAGFDFSGTVPRVTRIDSLFSGAFTGTTGYGSNHGMSLDGKHFVFMRATSGGPKLIVELNRIAELKAKFAALR
jgi:serine/threonine protein kinase/Tol biopolymer transport system component